MIESIGHFRLFGHLGIKAKFEKAFITELQNTRDHSHAFTHITHDTFKSINTMHSLCIEHLLLLFHQEEVQQHVNNNYISAEQTLNTASMRETTM